MERIATANDFRLLSAQQQQAHTDLLRVCDAQRLSCRCEILGNRDFTVTVAPGLSSAKWWLDRFDIDLSKA